MRLAALLLSAYARAATRRLDPGPSPVAQAPPFSTFEREWPVEYLAEALAEGIVTGHGPVRMPAFVFEPEEIDDLLAYLVSVQEKP